MSLDPLKMLRRDEQGLIPCAGGCGFMLDDRVGAKPGDFCLLCKPISRLSIPLCACGLHPRYPDNYCPAEQTARGSYSEEA